MVMNLDTIIECDVSDAESDCNAKQRRMSSTCEAFIFQKILVGKADDYFSYGCQFEKGIELCEPECELDPVSAEAFVLRLGGGTQAEALPIPVRRQVRSKKSANNRSSLIDNALKLQNEQKLQGSHSCEQQHEEPVYIRPSDLAADWSRYIPETSAESMLHSMAMKPTNTELTIGQPLASSAIEAPAACRSKRNRKKSLIDKAESQKRKEIIAQRGEHATCNNGLVMELVGALCSNLFDLELQQMNARKWRATQ
jgi:hypothetical protein|mmetsp:Transcript_10799/g.17779  ORF Transcript_10799/g.17779 Transcript_10799/m.17779 type:complete len:254 (+) Transcript_10799:51-812(+)|eukprot:CAMPEP_0169085932 /NCGR_PEP_ID=MMETSP1015-20121227/13427_1 /TAXON_ID=342587 /ORGANISM="Karlodinium micrum, Strain CCMP2283" /LENGTH=253 /DNA_ID=CAMNT_0009146059 /DNA_START=51 /DNA_END=812 /DNA_ORIENTATION=-